MLARSRILAHRGLWQAPCDKNTFGAIEKALTLGFGLETDIRDCAGEIVISHDMASGNLRDMLRLEDLFEMYHHNGCDGTLALNVKADGIGQLVRALLERYGIENYFLFDMSVPELVQYAKIPLIAYNRASEYESYEETAKLADGVWVDNFTGKYDQLKLMKELLKKGVSCALVSPELHGRNEMEMWGSLKQMTHCKFNNFFICTDFPEACYNFLVNET